MAGQLRINSQWRIETTGSELIMIGGQDAIYSLDLDGNTNSFFINPTDSFVLDELSERDRQICEQLIAANIVSPVFSTANENRLAVGVIGDPDCINFFSNLENYTSEVSSANLLILVRSNSSYEQLLSNIKYDSILQPHLFVDLAYHHTISLGPLVFPKSTSCVKCLASRVLRHWEHDNPPPKPLSTVRNVSFAREWTQMEIQKLFEDENYSLTNKTISINTDTMEVTRNSLLTLPTCSYCKRNSGTNNEGKIALQREMESTC